MSRGTEFSFFGAAMFRTLLKCLRVRCPQVELAIGELERCRLSDAGRSLEMARLYCIALLAIRETDDLETCHRLARNALDQAKRLPK